MNGTRPSESKKNAVATAERDLPIVETQTHGAQIPQLEPAVAFRLVLRLHHVRGHHRREQTRDEQRGQHRGDRRDSELLEELAGDAAA